jgi:hypothetical protein
MTACAVNPILEQPMRTAYIFDACGTLFDVFSVDAVSL